MADVRHYEGLPPRPEIPSPAGVFEHMFPHSKFANLPEQSRFNISGNVSHVIRLRTLDQSITQSAQALQAGEKFIRRIDLYNLDKRIADFLQRIRPTPESAYWHKDRFEGIIKEGETLGGMGVPIVGNNGNGEHPDIRNVVGINIVGIEDAQSAPAAFILFNRGELTEAETQKRWRVSMKEKVVAI